MVNVVDAFQMSEPVTDWQEGRGMKHRKQSAYMFFKTHAGYSVAQGETKEQGRDRDGNTVLASLGAIIDPSDEYRRVIEAELAVEATPEKLIAAA